MLLSLSIKNIALIDSLEIDFSSGLTILSGETGAGKSIIIDSINFVLGDRADKSLIRYGQNSATVEAEFDNNVGQHLKSYLDEQEIDYTQGIIISRVMNIDGKSTCRINGMKVAASMLKEVTGMLVDIYGQNDSSALLLSKSHLPIIDSFGNENVSIPFNKYREKYQELSKINAKLKEYGGIDDVNKQMKSLKVKIDEIQEVKLKVGEEDQLAARLKKIENAELMTQGVEGACQSIDGSNGACDRLRRALSEIEDLSNLDKVVMDSIERLSSSIIELEDVSNTLSRLIMKNDYDQYEQQKIVDRLDYIRDLVTRYGGSEKSTLERLAKFREQLDYLSNSEFEVIQLTKQRTIAEKELMLSAEQLSRARRSAAIQFEGDVIKELSTLGMARTKFKVEFSTDNITLSQLNSSGGDIIEFMISPNPGQPLKPLIKIISGGEMSRFMLALKKITSKIDGINVMIFDEIDTGISGNIATVVAKALSDISRDKQVLAITHLPQLASFADCNYYINKTQSDDTTTTSVIKLDGHGAIRELARLIGGDQDGQHAMAHANDMKASANQHKGK